MSSLFDNEFMEKIRQISLHIQFEMDGTSAGNRKSRSKGSSVEFSDYREYSHGDDFRRVDWNAYGRFEKLFVKLYMEEREAPVNIFLDVSRSMDWGKPNKNIVSRRLAAALGYVCLSNFDRVSMYCADDTVQSMSGNVRGKNFFYKLTSLLESVQYTGKSNIQRAVENSWMGNTRGITVLISDFFTRGSFDELIKYLMYRKQRVYACHILSPQEIEPVDLGPFPQPCKFSRKENHGQRKNKSDTVDNHRRSPEPYVFTDPCVEDGLYRNKHTGY